MLKVKKKFCTLNWQEKKTKMMRKFGKKIILRKKNYKNVAIFLSYECKYLYKVQGDFDIDLKYSLKV